MVSLSIADLLGIQGRKYDCFMVSANTVTEARAMAQKLFERISPDDHAKWLSENTNQDDKTLNLF